jgi:vacuolar-type H+-ATPase subunit F/Vma7
MDIVAIGKGDFALGLRLLDIKVKEVPDKDVEKVLMMTIEDQNVGIIILSEQCAASLSPLAKETALQSVKPVVVTLSGKADQTLRDRIRSVVGVDLVAQSGGK